MKKFIIITFLILATSASAHWTLIDCSYGRWGDGYPKFSGYRGLYKNSSGDFYTVYTKSYCKYSIN